MTPLKPIENTTRVRGVPSKRYPLNTVCAHPDCTRTDVTAHHIFGRPRGQDSDSWFVAIPKPEAPEGAYGDALVDEVVNIIPHATGLCGSGTTGHHGEVESHDAWIKYEDGEFVWYERGYDLENHLEPVWRRLGPLNPQPGSVEGKPKRKPRDKSAGPVKVASFKAPDDDPEAAERIKEKSRELRDKFIRRGHKIGKTVAVERALDFTLLNAGEDDF
jgi:hypothetical protein